MDKVHLPPGVADRLCATEKAIEDAIADAARFMPGLAQARLDLRIAVMVGEEAVGRSSQVALAETRRALVGARWRPGRGDEQDAAQGPLTG
ncbi:MAG TPA: hypothetical protein VL460_03540 [Caulobacteraceae bacterium]|jgi:hypothetical protein|nr:hypothetical protein [Caulobacteraceae bacterium]